MTRPVSMSFLRQLERKQTYAARAAAEQAERERLARADFAFFAQAIGAAAENYGAARPQRVILTPHPSDAGHRPLVSSWPTHLMGRDEP